MKRTGKGFFGHARRCDCRRCAQQRRMEFIERATEAALPALPRLGQTVYVRPHFRKQPGHLKKLPHTLAALNAAIARLVRAQRVEMRDARRAA